MIEHLGSAHTDAELAVLLETARGKMRPGQGELDLVLGEQVPRDAVVRGQVSRVLVDVVQGAWRRLGFDVIDDDAFFQLVLARVVEPTSKADSVRVLRELGVPAAHRNTFTATLRRCAQRDYRDKVAAACFAHAAGIGDISLCLYDVTTLYFEAEQEDDLRRVGYSNYAELPVMPRLTCQGWCSCGSGAWAGVVHAA